MSSIRKKPLVGIPASVRTINDDMLFHGNGQQYYDAIAGFTDACCTTIPALDNTENALSVVDHLDGILLTGSFSNIHPNNYGADEVTDYRFFDRLRDKNTFAIIDKALALGMPLFGICRGLQELNVALGGTLHQAIQKVPGRSDHRSDESAPLKDQFHPAHEVDIMPNGVLASLTNSQRQLTNSSHMQGIDHLAEGLRVEATADDGTIEAVSVENADGFALAVQFHPEWHTQSTPFYRTLFEAFSNAIMQFTDQRRA